MNDKKKTGILFSIAAFMILILLRTYKIKEAGFFDYDSVMNFLAAKNIAKGDFSMLFNHVSPSFNLFYGFIYKLYPDFIFLQYVNLTLNSVAIVVFVLLFAKYFNLSKWELAPLILLIGSSLFMVGSSRYFSVDAFSLLLVVLVLYYYYESITRENKLYLYVSVFLFMILFTINYKSILLTPLFVVTEFLQTKRKFTFRVLLIAKGIGLAFIVVFSVYGWMNGVPLHRYIAGIGATLLRQKGEYEYVSVFSSDLLYYFDYFIFLENPLIVLTLIIFPFLYRKELFEQLKELNSYQFFFIITYGMLAGMSLLAKAPRGILFIYPLLYLCLYLCIRRILERRYLTFIITGFVILYQFWIVKESVYNYCQNNYDKVGEYINTNGINKVAVTVGINSLPYIENAKVKVIFDEKELTELKKEGYSFVVVDDFCKAANLNNFSNLYKQPSLACYKSSALLAPLVFLEESEYTGLSFEETMAIRREAMTDSCQVRIVKLN